MVTTYTNSIYHLYYYQMKLLQDLLYIVLLYRDVYVTQQLSSLNTYLHQLRHLQTPRYLPVHLRILLYLQVRKHQYLQQHLRILLYLQVRKHQYLQQHLRILLYLQVRKHLLQHQHHHIIFGLLSVMRVKQVHLISFLIGMILNHYMGPLL